MGKDSAIEWTDHTFNPWWGCVKVSPGCEACYAETLSKRWGYTVWGPAKTTSRRMMSESYWRQPLRWNDAACKAGQRARVFCASMADVFEDHPQVVDWRLRLFNLIDSAPMLDWLLLTKRPENIMPMMSDWLEGTAFPSNIWIGTSVEDQQRANERIPHLLRVPARVRFLSCEPLLGAIDLSHYLIDDWTRIGDDVHWHEHPPIHWLIVGGESGPGARPMHPDWALSLRDQAQAAGVPFFFKQHGEYVHADDCAIDSHKHASLFCAGGTAQTVTLYKVGKHAAGRLLDGREWNEFPDLIHANT